ncbi:MAG: hypothetical protein Q8908_16300 [Bacteroidota bacterium]|nr:hypothetical protein [Bacteroidota bacterium]
MRRSVLLRKIAVARVNASTLLETLVALVICMVIFFMALSVILRSQTSDNVKERLEANALAESYAGDDTRGFHVFPDSIKTGKLIVVEKTIDNDTILGLYLLELEVFSEQKVLLAEKRMVKRKNIMTDGQNRTNIQQ